MRTGECEVAKYFVCDSKMELILCNKGAWISLCEPMKINSCNSLLVYSVIFDKMLLLTFKDVFLKKRFHKSNKISTNTL